MRNAISKFLLAAMILGSVFAQNSFAQGMDPEQRIQQMIASLEVTKEQEPKFREVMNAYFGKMRDVMQSGDRSQMGALMAEQETNLSTVLNETQMAKYREQQAARRARMSQGQ